MNEPSLGPCSKCGERPATCHVTTVVHGKVEKADLCAECFAGNQPAAIRDYMEALQKATCVYCGAKAVTGLSFGPAWLSGEAERFACHECFQEHHSYFLNRLEALSGEEQEAPGEQGMNQIRAIREDTDAHMQRWISQKLN